MNPIAWFPQESAAAVSSGNSAPATTRLEVCPPSLRVAPSGNPWQRFVFWLLAPAPHDAAPPVDGLPSVRTDFAATIADIDSEDADRVRHRIAFARSLRELWHLRADMYRLVAIAHSQSEAETRLSLLARHFPTRSPRSQLAPL